MATRRFTKSFMWQRQVETRKKQGLNESLSKNKMPGRW